MTTQTVTAPRTPPTRSRRRALITVDIRLDRRPRQDRASTRQNEGIAMIDLNELPADLPAPEDDGTTGHLLGQPVPHLSLPSTSDDSIALDELGPGRSVLYLYPLTGRADIDPPDGWDNIPGARGCTAEACDFRNHHADLLAAGATAVYGLSSQDTAYQREVVERLRLPFAMLSDPQLSLAHRLGLPTFQAGELTLFKRLTLLICDEVIEHVYYPVFPPNQHAEQVLTWLRAHAAPEAPDAATVRL